MRVIRAEDENPYGVDVREVRSVVEVDELRVRHEGTQPISHGGRHHRVLAGVLQLQRDGETLAPVAPG